MSSCDMQESETLVLDASLMFNCDIKMEDTSLSSRDGGSTLSTIGAPVVVKVEYGVASEDEINHEDPEPENHYSALKRTGSRNFPTSPGYMSGGEQIFVKVEDSASNLSVPKVEKEVSSEDAPNVADSERENGSSASMESGNAMFSRQINFMSGSENISARASNFNPSVGRVGNPVNSEDTPNITGNACNFFSARSGGVKIKVEKVDSADILTSAERISHHTDSSFVLESNVSIKHEEDSDLEEESEDPLGDNHTRDFTSNLEVSRCDEKFHTTACDETNGSAVWGLCQEPCSNASSDLKAACTKAQKSRLHADFLSNEKSVRVSRPQCRKSESANNVNKCEEYPRGRKKSRTSCDTTELKEASVPKPRRSSQRPSEIHTNSKFCRCINCTGECKSKEPNDTASKSETVTSPTVFICWYCTAKFKGKFQLKVHLRSHTGETPYACTHCPAKFSRKNNFKYHLKSHTGEKPFPCTQCSSKFKKKSHLDRHVRTHTGERPFLCTYCPARFRQSNGLKDHLRTHTDEKPYACTVCSAKFRQRHTLKHHVQMHAEISKSS